MVVRGVPRGLAKDGWWLDDPGRMRVPGSILLIGLVVCADVLIWTGGAGLGFVLWVLLLGVAAHVAVGCGASLRRSAVAWAVLVLSLIPAIDLVQVLSVLIALMGLTGFAVLLVLPRWDEAMIIRAMLRLPGAGVALSFRDASAARPRLPSQGAAAEAVKTWLVPLVVGLLFFWLVSLANPVISDWIKGFGQWDQGFFLDWPRLTFWVLVAGFAWPMLRLIPLTPKLTADPRLRGMPQTGLLNAASLLRALLVFNLIFALQSVLDAGYLWAGVALPEGMTYAEYAHRGAYPLLVAALLAGIFALLAQPYLQGRPILRRLLYLWIVQTVVLVLSSILRLDLYVEAYGLTRLRFAALIWMVVVALGLVLMIMQMTRRHSAGWFIRRAAGLGLLALYAVSLFNVDGLIARNNLARSKMDHYYLCTLSEGVAPALMAYGDQCHSPSTRVSIPEDWREWGFRNARLRRSLERMGTEVQG